MTSLAAQNTDLELPTPAEHVAGFDIEQEARALGERIVPTLDPVTVALLLARLGPSPAEALRTLPPDAVLQLIASVDLSPWRQDVLELLLHQSQILDAGAPSKDDLFLLSMRVHQLDFDADRADERTRIEALLRAQGGAMRLDPEQL